MFTGIIEEIGKVKAFQRYSNGAEIEVECSKVIEDCHLGDSIAINGVCQTVVSISKDSFVAKVSDETLKVTTFDTLKKGCLVNLERALTLSTRLGGHIVSGHVDCVGRILLVKKYTDFYDLFVEIPKTQERYVIHKGSITINGISLTIAEVNENVIKLAIIPHTFNNTNLKELCVGDTVNIETDILGKYVEKFLSMNDNKKEISMEFLAENGFV